MSESTAVANVEASIDALDLSDATVEEIALAHQRLKHYMSYGKALERKFKDFCIAWIEQHGENIVYTLNENGGKMILTVGHRKDVKCKDLKKAIELLTKAAEGNWDDFVLCLSSNALKHGEARKLFKKYGSPELFDECFETVVVTVLKDGSEAKRDLIETDTSWVR